MTNTVTRMEHPSHPGRILAHFFDGSSVADVASHLGISRVVLGRILSGKASVNADLAVRLAEAFKTEPELWLRLQMQYDLWIAARQQRPRIKPFEDSASKLAA
jgi:addiction module HigA family antidote